MKPIGIWRWALALQRGSMWAEAHDELCTASRLSSEDAWLSSKCAEKVGPPDITPPNFRPGVVPPVALYNPTPVYSEKARHAHYEGTEVLWIVVTVEGTATDVRVVKPLGLGLDQNAIKTVRTWKFQPATLNGVNVPVLMAVEIAFRLV